MKKILKFTNKNIYKILFVIILLLAIITRIYRITELPHGINVDEAGMAYDAYCLANYGTDRYLNKFPVYLINFGGGQSALYAYLAAIFIKIFGLNTLTMRLPAILLGILAIVSCYFLTKKTHGEKFALTFMTLVTICPWHIMSSRWGLDCNLLAPMLTISILFINKSKKTKDFLITGILMGLTFYTYSLSYLIIPILLIFTYIYMLYTKKAKFKQLIIMSIPIIILALPLFLMVLVNKGIIPEIKSFITIPKMWFFRADEIGIENINENFQFYRTIFTNDWLVYNALPEYGTIYHFAIFLSVFGLFITFNNFIINIKKKEFKIDTVMMFAVIIIYICMLLIKGPNINKANGIYIPLLFLASVTIKHIYKNYKIFFYTITFLYIISFYSFTNFYFNKYEKIYEYQPFFERDLLIALDYVEENKNDKEVYIYTQSQQPWIYTLIKNKISPIEFNKQLHGIYYSMYDFSYGKYYFNKEDIKKEAVYIIKDNENLINKLKTKGFKIINLNSYKIAYK